MGTHGAKGIRIAIPSANISPKDAKKIARRVCRSDATNSTSTKRGALLQPTDDKKPAKVKFYVVLHHAVWSVDGPKLYPVGYLRVTLMLVSLGASWPRRVKLNFTHLASGPRKPKRSGSMLHTAALLATKRRLAFLDLGTGASLTRRAPEIQASVETWPINGGARCVYFEQWLMEHLQKNLPKAEDCIVDFSEVERAIEEEEDLLRAAQPGAYGGGGKKGTGKKGKGPTVNKIPFPKGLDPFSFTKSLAGAAGLDAWAAAVREKASDHFTVVEDPFSL